MQAHKQMNGSCCKPMYLRVKCHVAVDSGKARFSAPTIQQRVFLLSWPLSLGEEVVFDAYHIQQECPPWQQTYILPAEPGANLMGSALSQQLQQKSQGRLWLALTGSRASFCTSWSNSGWPSLDHVPLPGARGPGWSVSPKLLELRVGFENKRLDPGAGRNNKYVLWELSTILSLLWSLFSLFYTITARMTWFAAFLLRTCCVIVPYTLEVNS